MSEYFKKIFKKAPTETNEDEEAYQEQLRAFNHAQEILRQQQLHQEQKEREIEEARAGISIYHPDIHISAQHQDGLDGLLHNREKAIIDNSELTDGTLEGVKIKQRKQALSSMFHTIDALEKIQQFVTQYSQKQDKFSQTIQKLLKSDSKIK